MKTTKDSALKLLGISFLAKTLTHVLGGLIGICGMTKTDIPLFMENAANNIETVYSGILLQIVSSVLIIVLGVFLYRLTKPTNSRIATVSLLLFTFSAILLAVSQIIAFALLKNSEIFTLNNNASFATHSSILIDSMDFTMNIANIPFGLGTIFFFSLLLKGKIVSAWLSACGLITAVSVFIGTLVQMYDIKVPFIIMVSYSLFEIIAGIFLFIRGSQNREKELPINF